MLLFGISSCSSVGLTLIYISHQLLSPNFLVYLDAEVQSAERDSPAEHMLVIIQLKLLAEQGRRYVTLLFSSSLLFVPNQ